ncbi:MAG: glycoside hydrolase [Bacteroidetes bacterium]|nr:glycoside hydrolase [Bacteroidota bacterium]
MRPLRLSFLWHQHQPYYRMGDSFILPWVRLHAVKDYTDLLLLFEEFPQVKHTVNVVPSLLMQLSEYAHGVQDGVQELTMLPAATLSDEEKRSIARLFVLCNHEHMIAPYPRYAALADAIRTRRWHAFSTQDWLDLQVWYLLTWIGPVSRRIEEVARLFRKAAGFTEADKQALLAEHRRLMDAMVPTMRRLHDAGQIEMSVTPYMHPILPLLCNTDVAHEARPTMSLPSTPFRASSDAHEHVRRAIDMFHSTFEHSPQGMWPAEGSVSTEAIGIMSAHGIQWAATDEAVLRHTLGDMYHPTSTYFPWTVRTPHGDVGMLFRDHTLSDAIGFEYQRWDAAAAARDLLARLEERKRDIVQQHGEESLDHAVVPIILDGENCWEFYVDNGAPFVRALLQALSTDDRFVTVTCAEATAAPHRTFMSPRTSIVAGSWIDGNFDIWIGSPEKNLAWELLAQARAMVSPTDPAHAAAREALLIAEGSDWFWWYEPRHQAPNKYDFDVLFRYHLRTIYSTVGLQPPVDLDRTLYELAHTSDHGGSYTIPVSFGMSAMHVADVIARDVTVESNDGLLTLTLSLNREILEGESVTFRVDDNANATYRDATHLVHHAPVKAGTSCRIVVTEQRPSRAEQSWTHVVSCA